MLPSALLSALERGGDLSDDGAQGRMRRTTRDWIVDALFFLAAIMLGALLLAGEVTGAVNRPSEGLIVADAVVGLVCSIALWWRRRWPVEIVIGVTIAGVFSASAAMAAIIAMFTVAVHRRLPVVLAVAGAQLLGAIGFYSLHQQRGSVFAVEAAIALILQSAVVAWGLFVRARRQLLISLRDRADRAEAEQRLLADQARQGERTRIAREMHDVLAHRVSLIALQAGGLEVSADMSAETVRHTAGLIRGTARQALEELRGVIGVLRDAHGGDEAATAPQPTLADVPALVQESARAGLHVELEMDVADVRAAPATMGRDAYRIVQEALTNVNKHARGTATTVSVRGSAGSGLHVRVSNRLPLGVAAEPALPGAGAGLLGLRERVQLAGGSITHGATPGGDFAVEAQLPWLADLSTAAPPDELATLTAPS